MKLLFISALCQDCEFESKLMFVNCRLHLTGIQSVGFLWRSYTSDLGYCRTVLAPPSTTFSLFFINALPFSFMKCTQLKVDTTKFAYAVEG